MATIRDVARQAQVSVATVSRVLNGSDKVSDQARQAVIKAQKDLGFVLNTNTLTKDHSETVGVLVTDLSDPFFGVMVKACENIAHLNHRVLVVTQGLLDPGRERLGIKNLIRQNCSSLVLYAQASEDAVLAKYMAVFPYMVLINRSLPGYAERCLTLDNQLGMYTGVRYLIDSGHRNIVYVGSSQPTLEAKQRLQGYLQALDESGLPHPQPLACPPNLEGGARAARELAGRRGEFTAVVCYNDTQAAALMHAFNTQGVKIPDEVSVLGFDDIFFAPLLSPPLTSIKNPITVMAESAVILSSALFHHQSYTPPEFATELVVRQSVRVLHPTP